LLFVSCCAVFAVGCDKKGGGPSPSGSGSGALTATPEPPASGSGRAAAPPTAGAAVPIAPGDGVTDFTPSSTVPACKQNTADIGTYLQRGELSLGGRDNAVAAVWLLQIPNKLAAQVAFGGFDLQARNIARGRGIGASRDYAPRIFLTGGEWTAAWFDAEGLAHARPRWASLPSPAVSHLSAIGKDVSEDVALNVTPSGSLVVSAPFGDEKAQLSLFLFAPVAPDAPPVKALGVTKRAKQPRRPAVAADDGGYHLVWLEEGDRIVSSHFDAAGKESEEAYTVADAGEAKRDRLSLITTKLGALAMWHEGEMIRVRLLDKTSKPTSPIRTVGKGKWASIAPAGEGAVVTWVGFDGKVADQVLGARLAADGTPSKTGLRVSNGLLDVKDPPSVTQAGPRLAFAWFEIMNVGVSSKRAVIRILDSACLE
jgi:hypothetical protein